MEVLHTLFSHCPLSLSALRGTGKTDLSQAHVITRGRMLSCGRHLEKYQFNGMPSGFNSCVSKPIRELERGTFQHQCVYLTALSKAAIGISLSDEESFSFLACQRQWAFCAYKSCHKDLGGVTHPSDLRNWGSLLPSSHSPTIPRRTENHLKYIEGKQQFTFLKI